MLTFVRYPTPIGENVLQSVLHNNEEVSKKFNKSHIYDGSSCRRTSIVHS